MPAHRSSPLACFYSATLAWNQTAVDSFLKAIFFPDDGRAVICVKVW
jgi:hypothetical protein